MANNWLRPDRKLVKQISQGGITGERASHELFNRYDSYARSILYPQQFQPDEIESVYLDAMSAALLNIRQGRFQGGSSFKTYFHRILYHKSQDWIKAKTKRREQQALLAQEVRDQQEAGDFGGEMSPQELLQLIYQIFESTPASPSECVRIFEMLGKGFEWETIADQIGRSMQGAKNKRARCFEQLKKRLGDFPKQQSILASMYPKLTADHD